MVLFLFSNTVFYNFYSDLYSTLLTSDKACHKSSLTTLPYLFSFKYFFIPVIKSSSPSQLLIIRTIEAPYNINTEITIIYVILKSKTIPNRCFTSFNIIVLKHFLLYYTKRSQIRYQEHQVVGLRQVFSLNIRTSYHEFYPQTRFPTKTTN